MGSRENDGKYRRPIVDHRVKKPYLVPDTLRSITPQADSAVEGELSTDRSTASLSLHNHAFCAWLRVAAWSRGERSGHTTGPTSTSSHHTVVLGLSVVYTRRFFLTHGKDKTCRLPVQSPETQTRIVISQKGHVLLFWLFFRVVQPSRRILQRDQKPKETSWVQLDNDNPELTDSPAFTKTYALRFA